MSPQRMSTANKISLAALAFATISGLITVIVYVVRLEAGQTISQAQLQANQHAIVEMWGRAEKAHDELEHQTRANRENIIRYHPGARADETGPANGIAERQPIDGPAG